MARNNGFKLSPPPEVYRDIYVGTPEWKAAERLATEHGLTYLSQEGITKLLHLIRYVKFVEGIENERRTANRKTDH